MLVPRRVHHSIHPMVMDVNCMLNPSCLDVFGNVNKAPLQAAETVVAPAEWCGALWEGSPLDCFGVAV